MLISYQLANFFLPSLPLPHLLAGNLKVNGLERSLTVPLAKMKKKHTHKTTRAGERQTCVRGIHSRAAPGSSRAPPLSPAPPGGLPPWATSSPPASVQRAGGRAQWVRARAGGPGDTGAGSRASRGSWQGAGSVLAQGRLGAPHGRRLVRRATAVSRPTSNALIAKFTARCRGGYTARFRV